MPCDGKAQHLVNRAKSRSQMGNNQLCGLQQVTLPPWASLSSSANERAGKYGPPLLHYFLSLKLTMEELYMFLLLIQMQFCFVSPSLQFIMKWLVRVSQIACNLDMVLNALYRLSYFYLQKSKNSSNYYYPFYRWEHWEFIKINK